MAVIAPTKGDNWIKFLRAYGPVANNSAQEIEHLLGLEKRLGIPRLKFTHPAKKQVLEIFQTADAKKITIVTGTAGDGKTTMLHELVEELTGQQSDLSKGIETFKIHLELGGENLTFIYDLTAWKETNNHEGKVLSASRVKTLEEAAAYFAGKAGNPFVMAVNDGQLHEFAKVLPPDCSEDLKALFGQLLKLHNNAKSFSTEHENIALINLAHIPSAELMKLCLEGLLDRQEWDCLETEKDNPLFCDNSSIPSNYALLRTETVKQRLYSLAKISDGSGEHLPIRSITLLLVNILLGHPSFSNQLVKPGAEAAKYFSTDGRHIGALHLNLFGLNLTTLDGGRLSDSNRSKRAIFRFLNRLRIGEETTNDIDELLIFGKEDMVLKKDHQIYVESDPHGQRDPEVPAFIDRYIAGEVNSPDQVLQFRNYLSQERKRLFIHADHNSLTTRSLWVCSIYHYAGEYIENYFNPLSEGKEVSHQQLIDLASGLNRVWTGLFVEQKTESLHFTIGLDMSTAPVSDILLKTIDITDEEKPFKVELQGVSEIPQVIFTYKDRTFSFALTILRFEFLRRVAKGALPTCFSNEVYSDFLFIKQTAIRKLRYPESSTTLKMVKLNDEGALGFSSINLVHSPSSAS